MDQDLIERVNRAKELLQTVRHAAIATVNKDGSPHNTPLVFMHNEKLTHIYWASHPQSLHSQNVLRTGQVFVVLYDAFKRGGLFIQATGGHVLEEEELDEGLRIHNNLRKNEGKALIEKNEYTAGSAQKMWSAKVESLWINTVEKDPQGHLSRDFRVEIKTADLL